MLTKIISLFFLVHYTTYLHCTSIRDLQTKPCAVDDFQCFSDTFETFFTKTASGVPDLNIRPTDPLTLDSVNSNRIEGAVVHFKNVNVTGLKKQKLSEFKIDTAAKSVAFTVTIDANIASDVEMEVEETKKKFTGTQTASGNAVLRVAYDYAIKPNDKGVEYIESGPKTITCNFTTLKVDVNQELLESIANDPHAHKLQQDNAANIDTLHKAHECNILKAAYTLSMEAFRELERAYPLNHFLTNA